MDNPIGHTITLSASEAELDSYASPLINFSCSFFRRWIEMFAFLRGLLSHSPNIYLPSFRSLITKANSPNSLIHVTEATRVTLLDHLVASRRPFYSSSCANWIMGSC